MGQYPEHIALIMLPTEPYAPAAHCISVGDELPAGQ